jgi:hypothetical protein
MVVGLKLAETPAGRPPADSEIAELNPPETEVVAVDVPEVPWTMVSAAGLTDKEKLGVAPLVMVRVSPALWVKPPPLPVTVME